MKKISILILLVFLNTHASADRLVKNSFLNNKMGYEMSQNIKDHHFIWEANCFQYYNQTIIDYISSRVK
jgi:hypothetical protein